MRHLAVSPQKYIMVKAFLRIEEGFHDIDSNNTHLAFFSPCSVLNVVSDQIGSLFCDHNRRCVRVPANSGRHDGSIDDAQTFDPMDAELVIDHREIIMAHFTAASEMVNASGIRAHVREDLSLTLGLGTWEGFHVSEVCQRCGLAEPSCEFYPIDELLLICLM